MTWWHFPQNNSGGFFRGPVSVLVEADSEQDARDRGEASGLVYFDGVEDGRDCECCGDRWGNLYKVRFVRETVTRADGTSYEIGPTLSDWGFLSGWSASVLYADGTRADFDTLREAIEAIEAKEVQP